ncbi:MAG: SRPBCC family protein [Isosphaeraceae bacterium]
MKLHRFVKESRIAAPPDVVFSFHESPGAFRKLVPPWEHVEVESEPRSLQVGTRVVLRTKLGPFPVRWIAEHTEYLPGRLFADRQVSGPFAYWYHRHRFDDDGRGGTILRDEVEYALPLGRLGSLLSTRFVESKLHRMFDYRHEITRAIIESGEFPAPSSAA